MSMLSKNLSPIFRCFLATYTTSLGPFSPLALHFILHFAATIEVHPWGYIVSHCKQNSSTGSSLTPLRRATSAYVSTSSTVKRRKVTVQCIPVQYHAREYSTTSAPEPRSSESVQSDPPDERDKRSVLPSDGRSQPFPRNLRSFLSCIPYYATHLCIPEFSKIKPISGSLSALTPLFYLFVRLEPFTSGQNA